MDKKSQLISYWKSYTPPEVKPEKKFSNSFVKIDLETYNSFSDDELISELQNFSKKLNRTPAQWELPNSLCYYLRKRFKNYPTALRQADLNRSAGLQSANLEKQELEKIKIKELLNDVAERARVLGRPPHLSDMELIHKQLKKKYKSWQEVLEASGAIAKSRSTICKIDIIDAEIKILLEELQILAEKLNRPPMRSEIESEKLEKLSKYFGSWRNTLFQIGLEPVISVKSFSNSKFSADKNGKKLHSKTITDCNYKIIRKSDEEIESFNILKILFEENGSILNKNDVPENVRKILINACGTWHNVLYQLNFDD